MREVFFDFNGMPRSVMIADRKAQDSKVVRAKATDAPGSVGAPMPGVVLETKVAAGDSIDAGTPMVVLSAMKMESSIVALGDGTVSSVLCAIGDIMEAEDLLGRLVV